MQQLLILIKGMLMGAADVVPGVSGGTMAFITGIYERLISAIHSVDLTLWPLIRSGQWRQVWKRIDGTFLLLLLLGIGLSIVLAAKRISLGLEQSPHLMYAFFSGLIIASAWLMRRHISHWSMRSIWGLIGGIVLGVGITQITPTVIDPSYLMIFVSAAIAICAMILPGISGSFILLLLGMYEPIIEAIHQREIGTIIIFGLGAVVGLLSFVRVVKYMLSHHHDLTIAALIGIMLGSLVKLWPWSYINMPTLSLHSANLLIIGIVLLGLGIVLGIDQVSRRLGYKK